MRKDNPTWRVDEDAVAVAGWSWEETTGNVEMKAESSSMLTGRPRQQVSSK